MIKRNEIGGLSAKILLSLIFLIAGLGFAHETDSLFVPPKPKEPKRFCEEVRKWLDYASSSKVLVEITNEPMLRMDLRYGTFNNVTGHDLYCGEQRAFVHRDAYAKLKKTVEIMQKELPGYTLVIFDAARPLYAQAALKKTVQGTPYSNFVSSAVRGGLHNYGLALDLSLADSTGALLDMGTDFDSFERCAGAVGEADGIKRGRLTQEQVDNRNKLRRIMKAAGWVMLKHEWWHFNAYTNTYTREHYKLFPL